MATTKHNEAKSAATLEECVHSKILIKGRS